MRRSTDRILVTHSGTLPRTPELREAWLAGPEREAEFQEMLPGAVKDIVRQQVDVGIDVVNDGELGKRGGFQGYIRDRMSGIEQRPAKPGESGPHGVNLRDLVDFPGYHAAGLGGFAGGGGGGAGRPANNNPYFCTGPLTYVGLDKIQTDIDRLNEAVQGLDVEPYLPVVSPGNIEHWLWNAYYPDRETFVFAIADMMHDECKAITDAGIIVQIDDPDPADAWQMYPEWELEDYRRYIEVSTEALNHALRDSPAHLVRHHICWGSQHGPHYNDMPLEDFVDIALKVNAEAIVLEAGNPRHEHEWQVWEDTPLPDGKILVPGVVSHVSDLIEHPKLVAQRLLRYANVVGRENVIAGTDCGIGSRVGHAEIAWSKLTSLVEGARLASEELWN